MTNQSIIIKKAVITGVRNPLLQITGKNLENRELEIICDGNLVEYKLKSDENSKFKISSKLPRRCKKIEVFLVNSGHKVMIYQIENKLSYILKKSTKNLLKNTFAEVVYHKNKLVGIKNIAITGINNPLLTFTGVTEIENYEIEVVSHNNIIVFDRIPTSDEKDFIVTCSLPRKCKEANVFIKNEEKRYLIFTVRNKKTKRFLRKILYMGRSILMKFKVVFIVLYKGIKFLWREHHFLVPPSMWEKYLKAFANRIKNNGINSFYNPFIREDYQKWINSKEQPTIYEEMDYKPLISILIPVYNIGSKYLGECIDSILNQSYEKFEICLADDKSTNIETIETLKYYEEKDKRVKVVYRKENGHISAATNSALKIAKGEFIALVDNDDLLTKDALYEVVKVLNSDKKIDFIYSDEDKLDLNGRRCDPNFKPDYSPDTLLSLNYICHLSVIRKIIVDEIGGFTLGLEGAQDHDLLLRVTEKTNKIYHISKVLYHWRMVPGSTSMSISNKSYATDKGAIAIENALKRRKIKGHVEKDLVSTYYKVVYEYDIEPSISIIIPTRDYADILEKCLESLYEKTKYKNFEVIVVDNNSEKQETFELFDRYKKTYKNFKVVDAKIEFNYSKINNIAIKKSKSDYIVLLNNDTEILSEDWLSVMVGYAMQPHIGAVGPKLLYPDKTVQHAGVVLGLGGVASHVYLGKTRDDLGMYGRLRVPYNYSAVTAACLIVSKKKLAEVGYLEEDLMVAYNDMDLNIKLLKKGYYNICIPQIELFHHESKSRGLDTTSEKYKRFLKESQYMFNKWEKEIEIDKYYNINFSKKGSFLLDKPEKMEKKYEK